MITKIFYWIEQYIFEFGFCCIHEASHYLFVLYFWIFNVATFPKWNWTRKASIEIEKDSSVSSLSHNMNIGYSIPRDLRFIYYIIIPSSPAVFTVILFAISPWPLWILYLSHISLLWMSVTDMDKFKRYFKVHLRARKIRDAKITIQELRFSDPFYYE
jgi:hypothetical protein